MLGQHTGRWLLPLLAFSATGTASPGSGGQTIGTGYTLESHAIHGGGTSHATSADYQLSGTIGQPAPGFTEGGGYELHGGFWVPGASPNDLIFRNGFEEK